MNLPVIYQNYAKILANIENNESFDNDTLFIRGENSDYITDADFQSTKNLFPTASLATVPNAGHWVHAEAPKALLNLVTGFLD